MKSKSTISEIRFIACAEWILDAFADKLYRLVALLETIMVEIQMFSASTIEKKR